MENKTLIALKRRYACVSGPIRCAYSILLVLLLPEDDKVMKSNAEAPGEVKPTSFLTLTEATALYAYLLT